MHSCLAQKLNPAISKKKNLTRVTNQNLSQKYKLSLLSVITLKFKLEIDDVHHGKFQHYYVGEAAFEHLETLGDLLWREIKIIMGNGF